MAITSERAGMLSLGFAGSRSTTLDERRCAERLPMSFGVRLTTLGRTAGLKCEAGDISEVGMFVRAPADAGLCVGQRCEVNFEPTSGASRLSGLVGGTWFATVVRTEQPCDIAADHVGAGLRFDQPLFL